MNLSFFRNFSYPLRALFRFNHQLMLSTFGLITLKSASSGLTFLMILPLLGFVGLPMHAMQTDYSETLSVFFKYIGLSPSLISVLILFSLVMCATASVAYLEQRCSTRLQQGYNQYLRVMIHRAIFFSRWSFLTRQKKSDLVYVLSTEAQNIALCNYQLLNLMNQIFMIAAHTSIAFYLSWSMTSVAILTATALLALMLPVHRLTVSAGRMHLKANQTLQEVLSEQLGALKLIKSSGLEALSHAQFEASGQILVKQQTQFQMALARNKLLYACCSAIFFSALLYVGIQYLAIPVAQFFVLLIIYARILPMISGAQQVYQGILHKIPSYEHVQFLLNEAHQQQELLEKTAKMPFERKILFHKVYFQYPEASYPVFQDLTLEFKKNTTTALVGPSGVGKTTLVDLVVGLIEPSSGNILIDDVLLSDANRACWRQNIAYMTQDVFLFNTTIRENLLWSSPLSSDAEIRDALMLAAADFVLNFPQGLETIVGENGVFLSGGERQRLGLARAILQKPALLILDESTNALDQKRTSHIHDSLIALKGKMTILIISHHEIPEMMLDETIDLARLLHHKTSLSEQAYDFQTAL